MEKKTGKEMWGMFRPLTGTERKMWVAIRPAEWAESEGPMPPCVHRVAVVDLGKGKKREEGGMREKPLEGALLPFGPIEDVWALYLL